MAAHLTAHQLEVVPLPEISVEQLDPLLHEEIGVWNRKFNWDFRPSADLLRRFLQVHSLYGSALLAGKEVVGYAYHVCEGRKGLIGDFYLRSDYAHPINEMSLLSGVIHSLVRINGVRRIESQLMMLKLPLTQPLPLSSYVARHDRFFMQIEREAITDLRPKSPEIKVSFYTWEERFQEEIAHLVSAAYRGHVDSEINDQYRTIPGARHFLTNIVRYPGCGNFLPAGSVVAVDDRTGKVCGACLASLVAQSTGHVTQLCILPAIRRARLGYELLRHSLCKMVESGCGTVSLTVTAANGDAIRLYESVGFRKKWTFPALVWEGF